MNIVVNGVEIDENKAQLLMKKIVVREKRNLSSNELNNAEMIRKIKKMIEEEVECY